VVIAESLEHHLDPELEIERVPNVTHPVTAEHLEDLVALAEHLTLGEGLKTLRHVEGLALVLRASGEIGVSHEGSIANLDCKTVDLSIAST
jgi:hypothetical protein